jgi:hypothetical protein
MWRQSERYQMMMPRQMQILIHFLKMMIKSCRVKIPEDQYSLFLQLMIYLSLFWLPDSPEIFLDVDVEVRAWAFRCWCRSAWARAIFDVEVLELVSVSDVEVLELVSVEVDVEVDVEVLPGLCPSKIDVEYSKLFRRSWCRVTWSLFW